MRIIAMISLGIGLAGCTAGPVFKAPTMDLPTRFSAVAPVSSPSREDLQWWTHFHDPILDGLIRQGMTGNLSLAEARERLREAEGLERQAGGGVVGDAQIQTQRPNGGTKTNQFSLSTDIELAGGARRRLDAAKARSEAARMDQMDSRRLVLQELTVAYIDLRYYQQRIDGNAQDLRSRRKTLRDVQTQMNAGAATQLDLVRSKSLLAETQADTPKLQAAVIRQRNRISTLLGMPVGALNLDLGYRGVQPLPRMVVKVGVPADLLRQRPDIRKAERAYAAAVAEVGSAYAARYPRLSLSGTITAPLGGGGRTETLVAGLAMPVFTQPALKAGVDVAQARASQAYLQWRKEVLKAVEEVENALAAVQGSREAMHAARRVVALDEEALSLSRRVLESRGSATVLDLLDRERSLSSSRSLLAQNTRQMAIDFVALRVALGEGYDLSADPEAADELLPEATRQATMTPGDVKE